MSDKLKILLDENIPQSVAAWLRNEARQLDVIHVYEVGLKSAADSKIFKWAQENKATIVTFDEDFADRRFLKDSAHFGIVRLRVWPSTVEKVEMALRSFLKIATPSEVHGMLLVVDENKIRMRRNPLR